MTGQRIYENFVDGIGSAGLAHSSEVVRELVAEYEEEAVAIRRLVARMESVWRGAAAGAAQRGAGPLAEEHEQAAPPLGTAQDLNGRQAASFAHARNSVVPVPPQPGVPDPWAVFRGSGGGPSYYRQVVEHQAASQHNVDIMTGYTQAATYNTEGLPHSYGSFLADRGTVTVEPADPDRGTPTSAEKVPRHANTEQPSRTERVSAGAGEPLRDITSGGFEPAAAPPPGTAQAATVAATGSAALPASGDLPVERGASRAVSNNAGPLAFGPIGSGIPRNGTVAGPREPGMNGRAVGLSVRPAGGRAGAATGGALPFAAGARNRDEQDRERCVPDYLREEDPEAVFGTDEPTAPAVITPETG